MSITCTYIKSLKDKCVAEGKQETAEDSRVEINKWGNDVNEI